MADLSTLNPALPADGDAVSAGASRMREERDSILTSFGIEHALAGAHKFLVGNPAVDLPAFGNVGRIFIDTTNGRLYRDTGAAWVMMHAVELKALSNPGVVILTGAAQNMASITFATVPTTSSTLLLMSSARFYRTAFNTLPHYAVNILHRDPSSAEIIPLGQKIQHYGGTSGDEALDATGGHTSYHFALRVLPVSGTYTFDVQTANNFVSCDNRILVGILL